ncbi:MAG: hypothetical protein ABJH04_05670 [Cyclobacteriaceae bacterium]
MNNQGFNARYFSRVLAILFAIYISVSLVVIVFPEIQFQKRLIRIYKRYISPGPFFTASRITTTNTCYLAWKVDEQWTEPINFPLITYKKFFSEWNPTLMFKSRLERNIYEEIIVENQKKADSLNDKKFEWATSYFQKNYVPEGIDSLRITLIKSVTKKYRTKSDTIQIVSF